ncbi:MAG: succinate dehydrogenase cytochrome b subunit [Bacteroidales bacterium]|nr:succinate dehydrogenase cytochrome b subunit [Bacteroidales bacterium]MDZ4203333.1 succinate dehydrogenase cytochrome b subunit [Bacteroidales bacterium]
MSKPSIIIASISRKVITALAGLFLITFLGIHLIANLMMIKPDDGATFNEVVHFLSTNPLIKIMEIVLFAGFIIHILLAVFVTILNWMTRPVGYLVPTKSHTNFMSKYMFHTGVIILIFLVLHLWHFFAIKLGWAPMNPQFMKNEQDFYPLAVHLFQQPLFSVFYIVSFVFLGFHLNHALQSGFQTLGLSHNKYTPAVKVFSTIYSLVIAVGFTIIPLFFLFIYKA